MRLIILHGPPGVGKLTVARELIKITGFKLIHNHLINDLLGSVFDFGTPSFAKLAQQFRIALLTAVSQDNSVQGVIMTFCYAKRTDDVLVRQLVDVMQKYDSTVRAALLVCDHRVLYKRIQNKSRKKFGKIKTVTKLKAVMKRHELGSPISFIESIIIDNTKLSPRKVAEKIKKELL